MSPASRRSLALIVPVLGLGLLVALGPRVPVETGVAPVSVPGAGVDSLAAWLAHREARFRDIVPGAEKAVVWADSAAPDRTRLAVVYLHGYSATRQETAPLSERLAASLGANLFLTRLTGHGRSPEAMAETSVQAWLQDGEEALTVGTRLGERVVLVGTSTGGTLALWMASQPRWRERIAALLLVSPNLGVKDWRAGMLRWPWGGALARLVQGPEYSWEPRNERQARFWTERYPVEGLLPMAGLVGLVEELDLAEVTAPVWVAYSPQDPVVDPAVTLERFNELGAPARRLFRVEVADSAEAHVLAGDILAPHLTGPVLEAMLAFLAEAGVAPAPARPSP